MPEVDHQTDSQYHQWQRKVQSYPLKAPRVSYEDTYDQRREARAHAVYVQNIRRLRGSLIKCYHEHGAEIAIPDGGAKEDECEHKPSEEDCAVGE